MSGHAHTQEEILEPQVMPSPSRSHVSRIELCLLWVAQRRCRLRGLGLMLLLPLGLGLGIPSPGWAAQAELLSTFNAWRVYQKKEGNAELCYVAAEPIKAQGKYTRRGPIYALVSHERSANRRFEVSFTIGYTYKKGSEAELSVDRARGHKLITNEGTAWPYDAEQDVVVVREMIKGSRMVVTGTSSRGTLTTDTYSLAGFTKAMRAASRACEVAPELP